MMAPPASDLASVTVVGARNTKARVSRPETSAPASSAIAGAKARVSVCICIPPRRTIAWIASE
nr:hypothetical protein [Blastomonas sp. UPD001]